MPRRSPWPAGAAFPAALVLVSVTGAFIAGCGAQGTAQSAPPVSPGPQSALPVATGRPCGTGKTAAGVPVLVEIAHGQVACPAAMQLERAYATALASGKAPGNGGGGPVGVRGWVCTGFETPQILRTGDASKCTKGSMEILAVLPSPSPSPSS